MWPANWSCLSPDECVRCSSENRDHQSAFGGSQPAVCLSNRFTCFCMCQNADQTCMHDRIIAAHSKRLNPSSSRETSTSFNEETKSYRQKQKFHDRGKIRKRNIPHTLHLKNSTSSPFGHESDDRKCLLAQDDNDVDFTVSDCTSVILNSPSLKKAEDNVPSNNGNRNYDKLTDNPDNFNNLTESSSSTDSSSSSESSSSSTSSSSSSNSSTNSYSGSSNSNCDFDGNENNYGCRDNKSELVGKTKVKYQLNGETRSTDNSSAVSSSTDNSDSTSESSDESWWQHYQSLCSNNGYYDNNSSGVHVTTKYVNRPETLNDSGYMSNTSPNGETNVPDYAEI